MNWNAEITARPVSRNHCFGFKFLKILDGIKKNLFYSANIYLKIFTEHALHARHYSRARDTVVNKTDTNHGPYKLSF